MSTPLIRTLRLRNYKSIESCDLTFEPLTVFVGRNGAGKSNILDALRFTTDALQNTLEFAMRERGGIGLVRRKSLGGRPTHPFIRMELTTDAGFAAYGFRIAAVTGGKFRVDREECELFDEHRRRTAFFSTSGGEITHIWPVTSPPKIADDRLSLALLSGFPVFRGVFDALTRMTFHNLNPEQMKYPARPEPGDRLTHDGRNIASVIKQLQQDHPEQLERVCDYLRAIGVPIDRITHKQVGAHETFEVSQETEVPAGSRNTLFDASALSDGTIRALGILVSLLSARASDESGPSLVGIEEPETALHPAAVAALVDALLESIDHTQIILTCHSPDLLDRDSVTPEMVRIVVNENGTTRVGIMSKAKQRLLQEHLSTAGELLRLDQLAPDPADLANQREMQGRLFEPSECSQ